MAIFPVILCGGAGTRLWPASRPERPKQFLDLVGDRSLFQDTAARVAPLATDGGRLVVVAGAGHRVLIEEQLGALDLDAVLLLEPEGRDSAPAMAAAAVWIARASPDGVALFVASDHYLPDAAAFQQAAGRAAEAAQDGRIVTFGVRPTELSSAYGYIDPAGPGLSPVRRFVEKPDRETAERYVADGYLWNSGNFVVRADVLLGELDTHAPEVSAAARRSLSESGGRAIHLTDGFRKAPRISIDYAVMERSDRVSVLPVDFRWSDLGAWNAVAATGAANRGVWVRGEDGGNLVRAADGMVVATAGVTDLAIIAERDAVLVCRLDRSQDVKGLVERVHELSPGRLAHDPSIEPEPLAQAIARFDRWMRLSALPLWATLGADADGGFVESLDADGRCPADFRRARVQARQAAVFALAGAAGWVGPWRRLVEDGLDRFEQTNLRLDGLYRTRVARDGASLDDEPWLYDQAFVLFAFAEAARAGSRPQLMQGRARRVIEALQAQRHPAGGWREAGPHPFQANAHMHLLEACLAWEDRDADGPWTRLADEIVALARARFIDSDGGFLREFFDADWRPAPGDDGHLVEPGHQFEWAWLLTRWGDRRRDAWAAEAAAALYAVGDKGVDAARHVAIDELDIDLHIRSSRARLWPQTERLKAALILAGRTTGEGGEDLRSDTASALQGLDRYLEPTGLWTDKMGADGALVPEPAPASSLYHIAVAWREAIDRGSSPTV